MNLKDFKQLKKGSIVRYNGNYPLINSFNKNVKLEVELIETLTPKSETSLGIKRWFEKNPTKTLESIRYKGQSDFTSSVPIRWLSLVTI